MAQVKIILTAPHTHAGQQYQAGETLELDESSAQFIIRVGAGKQDNSTRKPQKMQSEETANAQ